MKGKVGSPKLKISLLLIFGFLTMSDTYFSAASSGSFDKLSFAAVVLPMLDSSSELHIDELYCDSMPNIPDDKRLHSMG